MKQPPSFLLFLITCLFGFAIISGIVYGVCSLLSIRFGTGICLALSFIQGKSFFRYGMGSPDEYYSHAHFANAPPNIVRFRVVTGVSSFLLLALAAYLERDLIARLLDL